LLCNHNTGCLRYFHAEYGEYKAQIAIRSGEIVKGELPRHALRLIQDWAEIHQNELLENYSASQQSGGIIKKIQPLN